MSHPVLMALPAAVPSADIFATGSSLAGKFTTFGLSLGSAVIIWFLVKALTKAGTFLAAGIAIIAAVVLLWGITNITNPAIRKPFTDTVNNLGMSTVHPQVVASQVVHVGRPEVGT